MAGRRVVGVVVRAPRGQAGVRGEGAAPLAPPPAATTPTAGTGATGDEAGVKPLSLRRRPIVLALTLAGWTPKEIAAKLHVTPKQVRQTQYELRKADQLTDEMALVLDQQLVPRAVENLALLLENGDKDATFETLKGRGVFRKDVKVEADTIQRTFSVHFDIPAGVNPAAILPGQIVATPNPD